MTKCLKLLVQWELRHLLGEQSMEFRSQFSAKQTAELIRQAVCAEGRGRPRGVAGIPLFYGNVQNGQFCISRGAANLLSHVLLYFPRFFAGEILGHEDGCTVRGSFQFHWVMRTILFLMLNLLAILFIGAAVWLIVAAARWLIGVGSSNSVLNPSMFLAGSSALFTIQMAWIRYSIWMDRVSRRSVLALFAGMAADD